MPSPARTPDDGPPLLEVGRITRAHGLTGEVVVVLTTDREERLVPGSVLTTQDRPLTVHAARRHNDRWIVRFEEIGDRNEAYIKTLLYLLELTTNSISLGIRCALFTSRIRKIINGQCFSSSSNTK